jgi:hypothetical protein
MVHQEELAFLKAIATVKLSPALRQELRKAIHARKSTATITKKKCPTVATSRRQTGMKRKASQLNQDGVTEPATRRPAMGPATAVTSPTMGEQTAECSSQLGTTEGGPAYAAVVARHAVPRLTSGPLKPVANGPDSSEPAVSTEAAQSRKSPDLSGPLSGMPAGITPLHAHVCPRRRTPQQNTDFRFRSQRHAQLPEVASGILPQQSDGHLNF